jgi:hypothetical protein
MKRVGKIAVCLAGGLAFNAGLRADSIALPNNPYAPIVTRNVFDLNPLPKVDPSTTIEAIPPPKITPNGIMDVFGHLQVLFKAPDSGKPPKDNSYILSEGQRQDDIEVMKINEKAGIVTFNNHGTVQEIPLTSASASSTPSAATSPNISGFHPNGNNGSRFGVPGNFSGFNRGGGTGGNNSNSSVGNGSSLNPASTARNYSAQQLPTMTPEEQVIAMEASRELTKQQVKDGTMPPLPPTPMTPDDATGVGGAPLLRDDSQPQ